MDSLKEYMGNRGVRGQKAPGFSFTLQGPVVGYSAGTHQRWVERSAPLRHFVLSELSQKSFAHVCFFSSTSDLSPFLNRYSCRDFEKLGFRIRNHRLYASSYDYIVYGN